MAPIVIVNAKTYPQATGERAVKLAQQCAAAAQKYGVDIRLAVQATDVYRVALSVHIPIYAQHADSAPQGKATGWVTAAALKAAGARGVLINHSEHPLTTDVICHTVHAAQKEKLETIVFAGSVARLKELDALLKPTYFCIEPPELISGDVSVAVAQPDMVKQAILSTKRPVLMGAGVRRHEDMAITKELGSAGVLLASGIVLAAHRERAFRELLSARAR